jgi:2-oxoglutarate ferredoxin oxidoreductase subunit delta
MARADLPSGTPVVVAGGATLASEVEMVVATDVLVGATPTTEIFEPLEIAEEHCKGCGLCVDVCPKHVLELDVALVNGLGYHPVRLTDADACTSCALCARICPDAVLTVYARAKGRP